MLLDRFKRRLFDRFRLHPQQVLAGQLQPEKMPPEKTTWRPQVRRLEKRIALNATAELNPLGQLIVMGTAQDDVVEFDRVSNDRLILRDEAGDVIPIANHPRGVGFESTAIELDDIIANRIRVNLGEGNDALMIGPIDGFNIVVADDQGNDNTEVQLSGSRVPQSGTLRVDSELITLTSPNGVMNLGGVSTGLIGNVVIEDDPSTNTAGAPLRLVVDQRLTIEGSLTLEESLQIRGDGLVDFSDASVSASQAGTSIDIRQDGADVLLGRFSNDSGAAIDRLSVVSASRLLAQGDAIVLDGEMSVSDIVGTVRLDSTIDAESVFIDAGDQIRINQDVNVDESIFLRSQGLRVDGSLATSVEADGEISLFIQDEVSFEQSLTTNRLTGNVAGDFVAAGSDNQIEIVSDLIVDGDLVLRDNHGDLQLQSIMVTGQQATFVTVGMLGVGGVDVAGGIVTLQGEQISAVRDSGAAGTADVRGRRVDLIAELGIGQVDSGQNASLQLEIDETIRAQSNVGDIRLSLLPFDGDSSGSVQIESISTTDGDISVEAMQTLIVDRASISSSAGSSDSQRADFTTIGQSSDLLIGLIDVQDGESQGGNDVQLIAGDDVLANPDSQTVNVIADDLRVIAMNQTEDQVASIQLATNVNDFVGEVRGGLTGDLIIDELDSIRLASSDAEADSIVATGNGQILIRAGHTIQVIDHQDHSDANRKGDPEIDARGVQRGRISLAAPTVQLADDVQLHAQRLVLPLDAAIDQSPLREPNFSGDDNAIRIQSDRLELGPNIELFTGEDQGTARVLAPRPDVDGPDSSVTSQPTAFFDPNSISVNVLTQALANDATGILTFDVGTAGEKGLTVTLDWGDSDARRLQQIDRLDADRPYFVGFDLAADRPSDPIPGSPNSDNGAVPVLRIEHLYLQEDVLDSTENGRDAATSPFNVRFAVRHHESIAIDSFNQSSSTVVQQFTATDIVTNQVPGGVLTSTDNPSTQSGSIPVLESGRASFIIPSLTIPVAFIPVRDVIPEIETLELIVQPDTQTEQTNATIDTEETSVVATVSQEEYFRLRVKSPDPNAPDLIEPKKLPAEILQGGRLQAFLRSLPDANYEIEYVISDGNERSILQFDVRSGQPIIREGDLDEGFLQLKDLQAEPDATSNDDALTDPKEAVEAEDADDKRTGRFSRATRFARLKNAR